jgi:acyl-CoA thioesterase-2
VTNGIAGFLALLELEQIEVNIFRGSRVETERTRVFGGQVAAQALVAAARTVEHGRVHSLHAYFLRPGDPEVPILYEVDRIRDGRSFTTRRVVAIQHGRAIFNLACSFHEDEVGLEHQDEMPDVPDPESLSNSVPIPPDPAVGAPLTYVADNGLEIRYVNGAPWESDRGPDDHEQLWMRTTTSFGDNPVLHTAIATFASDLTLVGTILRRHGISAWGRTFFAASLDHCMWFHRPFRVDEWLFYDQSSPAAFGARGLSQGRMFTRDGTLVASVAQEGLLRLDTPA